MSTENIQDNIPNNDQENNEPKKKKKKKSVKRTAENIILVCLGFIIIFSGWKAFTISREYKENRETYEKVSEIAMPEKSGFDGEIDFKALSEVNPDIVGWIYYEDTLINYPIVQGSDNDYYLHITFEQSWAIAGTLFVDAVTEKPFKQFNTIVYGHHMKDGSMFGDFVKLKDKKYCEKHPQLELITPEGKYHLIICAFLNQPSDSEIYTTNIKSDSGKQEYIDRIISLADYTTGEEMTIDSKLVVLSTCAYEYQNARYMVIGKMVPWD